MDFQLVFCSTLSVSLSLQPTTAESEQQVCLHPTTWQISLTFSLVNSCNTPQILYIQRSQVTRYGHAKPTLCVVKENTMTTTLFSHSFDFLYCLLASHQRAACVAFTYNNAGAALYRKCLFIQLSMWNKYKFHYYYCFPLLYSCKLISVVSSVVRI